MFETAIERAAGFTRPIHTIYRYYGSIQVNSGAASLFIINSDGWALTCRHVAEQLAAADPIQAQYDAFKTERDATAGDKKKRHLLRNIEKRHGMNRSKIIELKHMFVNCVEGPLNCQVHLHPSYDVALLKFTGFTRLLCISFPVFARTGTDLKQGRQLCRLGFPFPEFSNFEYDPSTESIRWSAGGQQQTPQFPIDGMLTRLLADGGNVIGFEISTPGLRGQSGGPAFDTEGRVWGMQASTAHLDLDFDVDMEVFREGTRKRVKDSAFLHVGQCCHVDLLKQFMRENNVSFQEG